MQHCDSLQSCEQPLEELLNLSFVSEISGNCHDCLSKDIKIDFLTKKLALLEDIVKTSDLIAKFNDSLLFNQSLNQQECAEGALVSEQVDASVQTMNSPQSNGNYVISSQLEYDCLTVNPQSFVLTDDLGNVEMPDSLFLAENGTETEGEANKNTFNPWDSEFNDPDLSSTPANEPVSAHSTPCQSAHPVWILDDSPFAKFSLELLTAELEFSHTFNNRKSVYFGDVPYQYRGAFHTPNKIKQDSYLSKLSSYINVILPNFSHNSVLINYYETGDDYIPPHSDSENCIEDNSEIVTVSLGATRTLQITSGENGSIVRQVQLQHGDVFVMSKSSQKDFRHEILPQRLCTEPRISITFRLMKPLRITQSSEFQSRPPPPANHQGSGYVPLNPPVGNSTVEIPSQSKRLPSKNTLFISSSMFRFLDSDKLSSPTISATKLFYPGADAKVMLNKLKNDLGSVTPPSDIYLMTGTNNVNSIYFGSRSLEEAEDDIRKLMNYVKSVFSSAAIHVINILPRSSIGRNDVVAELNMLIKKMCDSDAQFDFMDTRHLFNYRDGQRKPFYFAQPSSKIADNCHLNFSGVVRLAKFLKYWEHKHTSI